LTGKNKKEKNSKGERKAKNSSGKTMVAESKKIRDSLGGAETSRRKNRLKNGEKFVGEWRIK